MSEPKRTQVARETMKEANPNKKLILVIVVAVAVITVVAAAFAVQSKRDVTGTTPPDAATPTDATSDYGFVKGDDTAPVNVVVYEDPACPACGEFEKLNYHKLTEAADAGDITVETRLMNFLDSKSGNNYSTRAFNAYLSAREHAGPDVADMFRALLLTSQPEEGYANFSDDDLLEALQFAEATDEQRDAIDEDMRTLRFEEWIANAADHASKNGINQTPWVTVNGERVDDPFTGLWPAIEEAKK